MNDRTYSTLALLVAVGALYWVAEPRGQPSRLQRSNGAAAGLAPVAVEAQPLAANVERLVDALEYLGAPVPAGVRRDLLEAGQARDAKALQERLDPRVLLAVHINPEARVRVARGSAPAVLQQAGYTPAIVKIVNESGGSQRLRIGSPQAGPVYAGMSRLSAQRMQQERLRENENTDKRTDRFLELDMFTAAPMTANLSGLEVEYAIALIYSSESGRREATITFDVGQGTQDLGFRAEAPVLFDVKPAVAVTLSVLDADGTPTTGRFQFVDAQGHVFPPQAKRLAPDLFFQKHIYRAHGEDVLLPPGELTMFYGRGPEYRWMKRTVTIPDAASGGRSMRNADIAVKLERWVDPAAHGFYSGDHHIHSAGCAHYTSPTDGVDPADMFRQIKGEALNVGSVLTWGPGFDRQHRFFAPTPDKLSEPLTVMKYDIEVSGFGSEALGHVCLLNLKEQIYPGRFAARAGRAGRCRCCVGRRRRGPSAATHIREVVCRSIRRQRRRGCSTSSTPTRTAGSSARKHRAVCCRNSSTRSIRIVTACSAGSKSKQATIGRTIGCRTSPSRSSIASGRRRFS